MKNFLKRSERTGLPKAGDARFWLSQYVSGKLLPVLKDELQEAW